MLKPHEISMEFEKLCSEILSENGYNIYKHNIRHKIEKVVPFEVDFFAKNQKQDFIVEVKFYRSERENVALLTRAASTLLRNSRLLNKTDRLLIVSCFVSPDIKESIKEVYGVIIYDRHDLLKLAIVNARLSSQLNIFLEPSKDEINIDIEISGTPKVGVEFDKLNIEKILKNNDLYSLELKNESQKLKTELLGTPCGDGAPYEEVCTKILKFIFDFQLSGWHSQLSTFDSLYRYDLVCRVKSNTDMWNFVINEMKSRYVVFEFKNYCNPISQQQILTTEKYLSPKSFRSVAFIISRKEVSDSAERMCQGAMREHGKLIINLCDQDLIAMMDQKVNTLEPSDHLFNLVDKFLLGLPR
ncbi:hypothetical protein [Enterobacter cloacae]|uniref:restriction endonuclease n=1 Tax=Enterobacter cloacae TaxID=550 RepID=UPI0034A188FC